MNCVITSANIFSGQSAVTSRIFPVQLAGSVRKSTPDRPFICPILNVSLVCSKVSPEQAVRTTAMPATREVRCQLLRHLRPAKLHMPVTLLSFFMVTLTQVYGLHLSYWLIKAASPVEAARFVPAWLSPGRKHVRRYAFFPHPPATNYLPCPLAVYHR